MENGMNAKNSLIALFCLSIVWACSENSALTHETYTIDESTKEWYCNDTIAEFYMVDSNGITSSFTRTNNTVEYTTGRTSIFWIPTKAHKTEHKYQNYTSTYGIRFSFSAYPFDEGFGDNIRVQVGEYSWKYDVLHQKITEVSTPQGIVSLRMTSKGYKEQGQAITSTAEIIPEFTTPAQVYTNVLCVTINDLISLNDPYAIRKMRYVKQFGLVGFEYGNGEQVLRTNNL
ncbi:MAG: hypothetical protein BWY22_01976 [Bacteroidetes bacterium ADurb.Bin217]|nr:MAG: hypothetical protein BWY22_01976 [Bacteroidetes bacterium ADurb.Bin217]